MSEPDVCKFCGGPDTEDDEPTNSGTCGWCYYGMRMGAEQWLADLRAKGRDALHVGGCQMVGGMIVCGNPYKPVVELPSGDPANVAGAFRAMVAK